MPTIDDLISTAEKILGSRRSPSWVESLIRQGLLAPVTPHGRSGKRGGRSHGTWTQPQFDLYVEVIEQMANGATRPELCNVVAPPGCTKAAQNRWVPSRSGARCAPTATAFGRTTGAKPARLVVSS
jgi:hypothetical protein